MGDSLRRRGWRTLPFVDPITAANCKPFLVGLGGVFCRLGGSDGFFFDQNGFGFSNFRGIDLQS